jgi:hypothetical protein
MRSASYAATACNRGFGPEMSPGPADEPVGERILDLALYGPVGLALSVVEAVPGLVRKGRARLAPQVGMARTVGEFAVRQGYNHFVGFATSRGVFPFAATTANTINGADTAPPGGADGGGVHDGPGGPAQAAPTQTAPNQTAPTQTAPAQAVEGEADQSPAAAPYRPPQAPLGELRASELAIPSYDSLSATQVVQRLAGLSREEVAAVAAYEAATRRRRTVLVRAQQLLKMPG